MSRINLSRLQNEWRKIQNPGPGYDDIVSVTMVEDDMSHLIATIKGPAGCLYADYKFELDIRIPNNYPLEPPGIKFKTPIEHVNVNRSGDICLDTIKSAGWSPTQNILSVLTTITSLLGEPNADDPFNSDLAQLFRDHHSVYEQRVRDACEQYATK